MHLLAALRGAHRIEVVSILQDILLLVVVDDQGGSVLIHLILAVLGEALHLWELWQPLKEEKTWSLCLLSLVAVECWCNIGLDKLQD